MAGIFGNSRDCVGRADTGMSEPCASINQKIARKIENEKRYADLDVYSFSLIKRIVLNLMFKPRLNPYILRDVDNLAYDLKVGHILTLYFNRWVDSLVVAYQ